MLTSAGARLANRESFPEARQRTTWRPHPLHLDHWLAITELYAALKTAARAGDLTLREFQVEADARCTYRDSYGHLHILRPDALVRLAAGDMFLSWFIEVDRGTESPRRVDEKCRAYRHYELADLEYQRHGVFPGVVFIVPNERRAQAIQRVVASQPEETRGLFWVTTRSKALQALTQPDFQ